MAPCLPVNGAPIENARSGYSSYNGYDISYLRPATSCAYLASYASRQGGTKKIVDSLYFLTVFRNNKMTTKIINFQSENVKRIEAVEFTVTENGLTIIGGNNSSGKTSILDSIMWALGGDKYKPSMIKNNPDKESMIKIELTNGLVVERKGIDCSLKITDSRGMSGGQKLLNQLIGQMALNLPKFNDADSKGKAKILLGVLGIEDQLSTIEAQEKHLTTERHDIGVIEKTKTWSAKKRPI